MERLNITNKLFILFCIILVVIIILKVPHEGSERVNAPMETTNKR